LPGVLALPQPLLAPGRMHGSTCKAVQYQTV